MKKITCLLTAIIILFSSSQIAHAITYTDECNSLVTTEEVSTYQGFTNGTGLPPIPAAVDINYFNLANKNGIALATYKMRGVEKVRVKVHTKSSLYAANNNGSYTMGYKIFPQSIPNSSKYSVYMNPDTKEIFTEINGVWYILNTAKAVEKFVALDTGESKPINLVNFGVQVFYANSPKDNTMTLIKNYRKIDNEIITSTGSINRTPFFYETYEFDIPKTAEMIIVAVYDAVVISPSLNQVPDIRLARVEFDGNKIELGEKEEILPPPPPLPSSSSTPTGGGAGGGNIIKPSSSSKSSSSKSSSSKSSSSKSSSSKSSSSKSSSSKISSLKSNTSMVEESEVDVLGDDEMGKEESMVYLKIEGAEVPKQKTDVKSIAVTAVYSIIVLTGVVTFVLKVR